MKTLYALLVLLMVSGMAVAQVNDIKRASSSHHSDSRSSSGGSANFDVFFANTIFQAAGGIIEWQRYKLQKREVNPTVVSLEVMLQTAVQPSSYYIINPRIRGNWGLFSTDFRFNYLLEEDIDGIKHLRTNDWQILQLNLVTTRNVIFRVGGGFIHEAFGDENTFAEYTLGLQLNSNQQHLGLMTEYRTSEPRKEWNLQCQYRLFQSGRFHGYATFGAAFQRYYSSINVWGMQVGFTGKVF
jgi:hypothetical protein